MVITNLQLLGIVYVLFGLGFAQGIVKINKDSGFTEVVTVFLVFFLWPMFLGWAIGDKLDK